MKLTFSNYESIPSFLKDYINIKILFLISLNCFLLKDLLKSFQLILFHFRDNIELFLLLIFSLFSHKILQNIKLFIFICFIFF
jgi:hypothetical protein